MAGGEPQLVSHVCSDCEEGWESGHAELRKEAWSELLDLFGLKG